MKKLLYGVLIVVGLIIVFVVYNMVKESGCSWYLGVVNSGDEPATVSVSLAEGSWTVNPNEAKTIKIENQDMKNSKVEREFILTRGGRAETLKSAVTYYPEWGGYTVIDVTGDSCIFAVDYGPMYRTKDVKLPEGEPEIKVVKIFQGKKIFDATDIHEVEGTKYGVSTKLGEPLPEKIKVTRGTEIPKHVRLINVPCDTLANPEALFGYLVSH